MQQGLRLGRVEGPAGGVQGDAEHAALYDSGAIAPVRVASLSKKNALSTEALKALI